LKKRIKAEKKAGKGVHTLATTVHIAQRIRKAVISHRTRFRYLKVFKNTNKPFLIIQSVSQLLKRSFAF